MFETDSFSRRRFPAKRWTIRGGRGLLRVRAQCNPIMRFLARELGRIGRCASFKVEFEKCPLPNRASRKAQGGLSPPY